MRATAKTQRGNREPRQLLDLGAGDTSSSPRTSSARSAAARVHHTTPMARQTARCTATRSESGEELQQQGIYFLGLFLLDPVAAVVQHDRRAGLGRV